MLDFNSPYVFASSRHFLEKYFPNYASLHGRKLQDALLRSSILLYALYACYTESMFKCTNSQIIFNSVVKSISEDELELIHTVADSRRNLFSELVSKNELFRKIFICKRKGYSVNRKISSVSEYKLTPFGESIAREIIELNDYFCYDLIRADTYFSEQHSVFFNERMYFSFDNPYYKSELASQIHANNKGYDFRKVKEIVRDTVNSIRFLNESRLISTDLTYDKFETLYKDKEYVFSNYKDDAEYATSIKINTAHLIESLKVKDIDPQVRKILEGIKNGIDDSGYLRTTYKRNFQGRYYCKGLSIQQLPSDLRRYLFSDYVEMDMKCAIYTVLYNLALKFSIHNIPCIKELAIHPDEKRMELYNKYKDLDPDLTLDYIKTFLTSISYGANASPDFIVNALKYPKLKCVPLQIDGYGERLIPLVLAEDRFVTALIKEIREVTKMLSKVFTEVRNGRKYLINMYGNALLLDRTATLGKRLAHLYQSIESQVLMKVLEYDRVAENTGLLLHDGIYIRKSYISKINIIDISNFIYSKLGYKILYEIKE